MLSLRWLLDIAPWTHTAEDSVRVVMIAQGWLAHLLPSVPMPLLLIALGTATWALFHWAEVLIARMPALAPIAQAWSDRKSVLNPALVVVTGWLLTALAGVHLPGIWGALIGIIAAGLRSFVKLPTTPAAVASALAKAKAAVVLALAVPWILMAFTSTSLAATGNPLIDAAVGTPTKAAVSVWDHLSFSPGYGYRWDGKPGAAARAFLDAQLGYTPVPHFKLQGRIGQETGDGGKGQRFGEVRAGLVF